MTSYFDEHNCEPLKKGEAPNHYLHYARLLIDGGYWQDIVEEFSEIYGTSDLPPPTSKKCIEEMEKFAIKAKDGQCYICLKEWKASVNEDGLKLPCTHEFHQLCISPWLNKTNSCPVCRHEFPTDDESYEEFRRQKKRMKEREADLEVLHNSMFS